jgi:ATP-dependent Lon protease
MFVATANIPDPIPAPLRDRMEILEIPGYTRREKLAIARRHLIPKQLEDHGIGNIQPAPTSTGAVAAAAPAPAEKNDKGEKTEKNDKGEKPAASTAPAPGTTPMLEITDAAVEIIIDSYTREAGVRTLERQIASVIRGVAVKIAEGDLTPRKIETEEQIREFLGAGRYTSDVAERTEEAGVATGLAWTSVGGEILFIEATRMYGPGKLQLTGQLGDVMKESAQAALSYVRTNSERYGIARDFLEKSDIHIHIPAGSMPKDGPSAGVTMFTALVSMLTGVRVRHDVAMTGEITLRGRVLPIGGLKEKVLAAHRAGIKRVIVPERNKPDLDEVPAEVKSDLEFVFVSKMDQVLEAALDEMPGPKPEDKAAQPTPVSN